MFKGTNIDSHRKVLFVGGGTGGHFYPLIAIAEQFNLAGSRPELYYAGPNEYDSETLRNEGIEFIKVNAGKRRRYASILNYFDVFKTFFGSFTALIKLFILYPDVVVSKGGYTSVPIVIAAAILRIPLIVHESDAVVGKANRLGLRFARHVITSYDNVPLPPTKAEQHLLGIPIRQVFLTPPTQNAFSTLGIDAERPVILIIGGSQGAERINAMVLDSLDELLPDCTVIHQTGELHFNMCTATADALIPDQESRKHYHPIAFLNSVMLNDAYHLASLVISRAGSTSIYEIALHGKPSIIIPIPEDISHDQRSNAYAYARFGAALVMEEKNLSDNLLRAEIERIMQNGEIYDTMAGAARAFAKKDAALHITNLITKVSIEH
ncbi:UDP-N-acetylglucosamine--N-acetylmuramyl-(pentapeptide) pyrophosphoryl-undecaprenol N-acetylglucosamine transferase [Candidatus Kaiserbacteria bacterium]|nr:MAG: UDP-N-acetylglucosamine--N-acetylmuramyl-(pentapeptide) pyrophosphoryl-undecaprenol N-acetylglucosamine transferase [Candidatus Kaiserbacteria bacterium]